MVTRGQQSLPVPTSSDAVPLEGLGVDQGERGQEQGSKTDQVGTESTPAGSIEPYYGRYTNNSSLSARMRRAQEESGGDGTGGESKQCAGEERGSITSTDSASGNPDLGLILTPESGESKQCAGEEEKQKQKQNEKEKNELVVVGAVLRRQDSDPGLKLPQLQIQLTPCRDRTSSKGRSVDEFDSPRRDSGIGIGIGSGGGGSSGHGSKSNGGSSSPSDSINSVEREK